jgi:hypothetical protein
MWHYDVFRLCVSRQGKIKRKKENGLLKTNFRFCFEVINGLVLEIIGVRRGVSKRVKDDRRPPALWAGHP